MNNMGCSLLFMVAAALVVGFIPILDWMNLVVALPLALITVVNTGMISRKPTAQSADKLFFWLAIALMGTIILRILAL